MLSNSVFNPTRKRFAVQASHRGYSLGEWGEELERQAAIAVKGDYFETGKKIARLRRNDVRMNTEVREVARKKS